MLGSTFSPIVGKIIPRATQTCLETKSLSVEKVKGLMLYVELGRSGYSQDEGTGDFNGAAVDGSHLHVDWYEIIPDHAQTEQESCPSQSRLASGACHCFLIDNQGWVRVRGVEKPNTCVSVRLAWMETLRKG